MNNNDNIALFDMDGTLCDYEKGLLKKLNEINSPSEPLIQSLTYCEKTPHIEARRRLITSSIDFWKDLPKLQLGFDILDIAKNLGYRIMVLTQGPKDKPHAWSGKKIWIDNNIGEDTDITITRDKGLVYGKMLVDDYPEYIEKWLEWRPRGLVIMPASNQNRSYVHKQVIRYDGSNIEEIRNAMSSQFLRKNQ